MGDSVDMYFEKQLQKDVTVHVSGPNVLAMIRVDQSQNLQEQIDELILTLSEMSDYGREHFKVNITEGWIAMLPFLHIACIVPG